MNVSLTPVMEKFIRAQVKTGHYGNASEVVRAALRTLMTQRAQPKLTMDNHVWPPVSGTLQEEIQIGLDELARGEYTTYQTLDALFDDVRTRAKQRRKHVRA